MTAGVPTGPGGPIPDGSVRDGAPLDGPTPAVETRALTFRYPDGRLALDGVDLAVAPGERVALLGPNGAGKTTLALHLDGILRPAGGEVRVAGRPITRATLADVRRRVQLVFQDPDDQLFSPTVRDDVAFGPANLGLRGAELDARVAGALAAVGMAEHAGRAPHHLSFGQRRRVAVATVLAMDPDVLVLDEPTSNLDPAGRRELGEILARQDAALLVATHDLPFALWLCPRAVVLDEGRVVADGPTRDVLADAALMAAHRLELPYGFDPRSVPPAAARAADRTPDSAADRAADRAADSAAHSAAHRAADDPRRRA